jgi:hypothetical protein
MSGNTHLVIKAWMLPLIIVVLVLPGAAAFVLGGPGVGLAVGALTAATMVIVASLKRPDEPIEVVRSPDARRRLLLVAIEPADRPEAVETVREAADADPAEPTEVLVLAPALDTLLEHWATDVGRARLDAQRKLVLTVGALAAADVEARGAVGDANPIQAVEDTLREFAADEVIVAVPDDAREQGRGLLAELRRRLDLPVHPLRGGPIRSAH